VIRLDRAAKFLLRLRRRSRLPASQSGARPNDGRLENHPQPELWTSFTGFLDAISRQVSDEWHFDSPPIEVG